MRCTVCVENGCCKNSISPYLDRLPTWMQKKIVTKLKPHLKHCCSDPTLCSTHLKVALQEQSRDLWRRYRVDVADMALQQLFEIFLTQNAHFGFGGNARAAENFFVINQGLARRMY